MHLHIANDLMRTNVAATVTNHPPDGSAACAPLSCARDDSAGATSASGGALGQGEAAGIGNLSYRGVHPEPPATHSSAYIQWLQSSEDNTPANDTLGNDTLGNG